MRFEAAWYWLLLAPLLAHLAWQSRRSYAQLEPAARWGSLLLRTLCMLCLLAAITRPSYLSHSNHHHVVFLLDDSQSVTLENLDAAIQDIDRIAKEAVSSDKDTRITMVAFGRTPQPLILSQQGWSQWPEDASDKLHYSTLLPQLYIDRTRLISGQTGPDKVPLEKLEARIASIEKFRDEVIGEQTDLESALTLAANIGVTGERKTIYAFTDGQANLGRWQNALDVAATAGIQINTVKLGKLPPPEVAVAEVVLPQSVKVNQGFTAEVRVASSVETTARLSVFKDGVAVHEQDIVVSPGEATVRVPRMFFRDKGFHKIEASIKASDDTKLQNNTARALVVVPGQARVLYVDSNENQMPYLKSALELEGMEVEARPATGIPQDISSLLGFDAFILSNVPADRLTYPQMKIIRSYVRDFGGGFIMLGGDQSFGLGGYYGTPVEELLPVKMPIQKDMTRPSLAIMLVIDKSGSMSGVKIELAKRAALATSEAINPRDQIGVIGFDGEARVILELTSAGDRTSIGSSIAGLDAGGGTFLYPALEDAHQRLIESNARKKHVIVLSDGQTQGYGYEELVQAMSADGITLSSVGIGGDADMRLMEAIAAAGGGRAYFTDDFYSIPQIFTREALRASNSMLVEQLVQPVAVGKDACLDEIDTDELPLLSGYVATTAKPGANLLLASDSGDPILAKWRFGLGRTAAFTSDTKPRWAEDWIQWDEFARFWSQLVRSITGENLSRKISIEMSHRLEDDQVVVQIDAHTASGSFVNDVDLELFAMDSSGRPHKVEAARVGPGVHEARFDKLEYGRDQQFVCMLSGAQEQKPTTYGFVYSYSPEFRTLGPSAEFFRHVEDRRIGEVMDVGSARLSLSARRTSSWVPFWSWLLIAGLMIIPIDILVRRMG